EEDDEDDDEEEEVEEDENADYGTPVTSAGDASRPTLHAVMVAYGTNIGVDADVRVTRDFFRELQDAEVVNINETLLTGGEATAKKTLEAIKKLTPGKNDIVWVYYTGHGGMAEAEHLLCTCGVMLQRAKVVELVAALPARLKVVLTDCCAVEIGRVEEGQVLAAGRPQDQVANWRKLFLQHQGLLDATSSSYFQYSFGGVFTPTLVGDVLGQRPPETWTKLFELVQKKVVASTSGAVPEEMKKKLKAQGIAITDGQKPFAYSMPTARG
ncbi:MAG: caspase family protein, partial [Myxococcales bacterium]